MACFSVTPIEFLSQNARIHCYLVCYTLGRNDHVQSMHGNAIIRSIDRWNDGIIIVKERTNVSANSTFDSAPIVLLLKPR